MCGIAGILTARADLDLDRLLAGFRAALRHRGPDDEGSEVIALPCGRRLGLAHTRLSILDLSSAGHQPMQDPESGSWITFNGEIYNHEEVRKQLGPCQYRSTSDTETILKAWARQGDKALSSFRGMFAFALYDGQRHQFWLVRDRLGVKPLYVTQVDRETWMFASELRALLSANLCNRRLNLEAVESYLAFGAVQAPLTLVEGVQSLLPGESMRFDLQERSEVLSPDRQRYWRLHFAPDNARLARGEALERIRPALLQAVSLRMVADVPVGVFLSGGIDSTSVVAALRAQGHSVSTFSVIFDEPQFDESEHSRLVARHFNTKHAELVLRPGTVLAEFDKAITAYDQPSIDGLNTYFISQATRQTGIKVALSGLGGDELFAGYPYFRRMARLEHPLYRQFARWGLQALRYLTPQSTRTTKLRAILNGGSRLAKYAVCREVLAADRRQALLGRQVVPTASVPSPVRQELEEQVAGLDAINAHSLLELSLYMGNMLLRDLDQMSMAHALEVREPLLDHVLVETVASIPGRLKLRAGSNRLSKDLLVEALPTPLPEPVLRRRKMGFVFPWERWLRNELRQRVSAVLLDRSTLAATGLDGAALQLLWSDYQNHHPGVRYTDILCLTHLLYWAQEHRLSLSHNSPPEGMVLCKKLKHPDSAIDHVPRP